MTLYIAPIVEGQTEVKSVERLLQRVWAELPVGPERLQVVQPTRGNRDALIDPHGDHLANKLGEGYAKLSQRLVRDSSGRGLLLLLLDAEGDCPKELAPRLLQAARQAQANADIACVIAKRMLENWIMGGASTLAGVNGLPDALPQRSQFEDCSGSAWLKAQLRSKNQARTYKKTVDAEVFVRSMDLAECRTNCPSFDKLCRELAARLPGANIQEAPPATDTGTPP
jgi:hypothetical protein